MRTKGYDGSCEAGVQVLQRPPTTGHERHPEGRNSGELLHGSPGEKEKKDEELVTAA